VKLVLAAVYCRILEPVRLRLVFSLRLHDVMLRQGENVVFSTIQSTTLRCFPHLHVSHPLNSVVVAHANIAVFQAVS
jgi:hypothetical protein